MDSVFVNDPEGYRRVSLFVPGVPAPGGSKTAFPHAATGRMIVVDACKRNPAWRKAIQLEAKRVYRKPPTTAPVSVTVTFVFDRPASHYRTGRNRDLLRQSAPANHAVKPDTTKLWRAAEDALTGLLWHDDAQITSQSAQKVYKSGSFPKPGMHLEATWWED